MDLKAWPRKKRVKSNRAIYHTPKRGGGRRAPSFRSARCSAADAGYPQIYHARAPTMVQIYKYTQPPPSAFVASKRTLPNLPSLVVSHHQSSSRYNTSPTITEADLYVSSNFWHFSRSALIPSSSYSKSLKRSSRYSSLTRRFCTTSLEWLTSRCMTALGTWSAIVSRTILK